MKKQTDMEKAYKDRLAVDEDDAHYFRLNEGEVAMVLVEGEDGNLGIAVYEHIKEEDFDNFLPKVARGLASLAVHKPEDVIAAYHDALGDDDDENIDWTDDIQGRA
jgi:predicted negative regulator of RcsB-dependent stress response